MRLTTKIFITSLHLSLLPLAVSFLLLWHWDSSPPSPADALSHGIPSSFLIGLSLALGLATFNSRWLSRRVDLLIGSMNALAKGDFTKEIKEEKEGELGGLIQAYEMTRQELWNTRKRLLLYSEKLEELVDERTRELNDAQSKLLESAHRAGMAEVATGVLHNIGNINTTINVTLGQIISSLKNLPATSLLDVTSLMKEQGENLCYFLQQDPRGQNVLPYMELLLSRQNKKIDTLLGDSLFLSQNLAHINDIIRLQQSYARESISLMKDHKLEDLVAEALRILEASSRRRKIKITSRFQYGKPLPANRSQLIQIIVNLVKNAIESFDGTDIVDRHIHISEYLRNTEGDSPKKQVILLISDNGSGFDPSLAVKIFNYGFTTKTRYSGSGYGLHFCANYLQSIGGELHAHSDGTGRGASFSMKYPLQPVQPQEIESTTNRESESP